MVKRGRPSKGPKGLTVVPRGPAPLARQPYKVGLTASAEERYLAIKAKADASVAKGDTTSQNCTDFRMVDEALRSLIPADPTAMKYALHKPLDDLYRIAKGRIRIAWIVCTEHRAVLVVFISNDPRREGDKRDPYAILTSMAKAGYLQKISEDWRRALYTPPDAPVH